MGKKSNKKTIFKTTEELLDLSYGKKGNLERDRFDKEFEDLLCGLIIKIKK